MPESRSNEAKPATGSGRRSGRSHDQPRCVLTIVGIGASAGGLDACRKLLDGMQPGHGMAFILVQHLDPTHESMMVDLLAGHTAMIVRQAGNNMRIEPEHLYVIPPGAYLSVADGKLHLSQPLARHGARLPFDFLLNSLAESCGPRAIAVVLSGTGADGSLGVQAVRAEHGLVMVQDPEEASFDGMPRSAIATGAVDRVLPVAKIAEALLARQRRVDVPRDDDAVPAPSGDHNAIIEIVDLLRTKAGHDFTFYKPGTLERRIQRRMAMATIGPHDTARYLALLRNDATERDLLVKDLLINVTSFFRDAKVFQYLAERIIPDLLRDHATDRPLRIWVPGCSSGEETYSLVMLFRELINGETSPGISPRNPQREIAGLRVRC